VNHAGRRILWRFDPRLTALGLDGGRARLLEDPYQRAVMRSRGEIEAAVCGAVHHDISIVTGEEVIVITLAVAPECRGSGKH